jgi:hypothetical protein
MGIKMTKTVSTIPARKAALSAYSGNERQNVAAISVNGGGV